MAVYHRITLGGGTPLVVSYPTKEGYEKGHTDDKNVFGIASETDCAKLSIPQMIDVINYLGTKKIKSLHDRTAGAKRLWAVLTTRKDPDDAADTTAVADAATTPAAPTLGADAVDLNKSSVIDEKTLAASTDGAYEGGQAGRDAAADQQDNQEADMAKASKKAKSKTTKTKTPKAPKAPKVKNVDKFGLRTGSKNAEAARLMARPNGATMAAIKEAVGDTKYNLVEKLKNGGHKVKKDGETYFLTAKGE